jgi:hypothetical protein
MLHTRSYAPGGVLEGGGRPVTINVPSRYIPVMGVVLASVRSSHPTPSRRPASLNLSLPPFRPRHASPILSLRRSAWARMQRAIPKPGTGSDANDFLHGWLNYQIEHHMFPDLSMLSYQVPCVCVCVCVSVCE